MITTNEPDEIHINFDYSYYYVREGAGTPDYHICAVASAYLLVHKPHVYNPLATHCSYVPSR